MPKEPTEARKLTLPEETSFRRLLLLTLTHRLLWIKQLLDATLYPQTNPKCMCSDAMLCFKELPDETYSSVLDATQSKL